MVERRAVSYGAQAGIALVLGFPVRANAVQVPITSRDKPASSAPLPETERAAREILTLPCHSELTSAEISAVTEALQILVREAPVG